MADLRYRRLHLAALAVAVAIAVGLLMPIPPEILPAELDWSLPIDKVAHFALFLVAAMVWRRSFAALGWRSPGIAVVVVAALYGGLLELAQGLWTERTPELADLLAGTCGALIGVLVFPNRPSRKCSGRTP